MACLPLLLALLAACYSPLATAQRFRSSRRMTLGIDGLESDGLEDIPEPDPWQFHESRLRKGGGTSSGGSSGGRGTSSGGSSGGSYGGSSRGSYVGYGMIYGGTGSYYYRSSDRRRSGGERGTCDTCTCPADPSTLPPTPAPTPVGVNLSNTTNSSCVCCTGDESESSSGLSAGFIVLIVFGCAGFCALCMGIVCCYNNKSCCFKEREDSDTHNDNDTDTHWSAQTAYDNGEIQSAEPAAYPAASPWHDNGVNIPVSAPVGDTSNVGDTTKQDPIYADRKTEAAATTMPPPPQYEDLTTQNPVSQQSGPTQA